MSDERRRFLASTEGSHLQCFWSDLCFRGLREQSALAWATVFFVIVAIISIVEMVWN